MGGSSRQRRQTSGRSPLPVSFNADRDQNVRSADLSPDLPAREIARPGVRWRHAVVRVDIDVGITIIHLSDESTERLSGKRAAKIGCCDGAYSKNTIGPAPTSGKGAGQKCYNTSVHSCWSAAVNVRSDDVLNVGNDEPVMEFCAVFAELEDSLTLGPGLSGRDFLVPCEMSLESAVLPCADSARCQQESYQHEQKHT